MQAKCPYKSNPISLTTTRMKTMTGLRKVGAITVACMFGIAAHSANADTTLQTVKERDKVICGANGGRPGFSGLDSKGQWQGIDVEVCRAIAAATLGNANKTQFVKPESVS
jgi:general L-amino acid transport system substrate-binding protein